MLLGFVCAALLAAAGDDDNTPTLLTAREHPWGNYLPQTWRTVETLSISNVGGRLIHSRQTVRTVLKDIDETGVTLEETELTRLGGRIIEKPTQTVKYDFFQERIQSDVKITQGAPVKLMIKGNRKIVLCSVRIYEQLTSSGILTTTICYTPQVYPYVLRVEKILRSAPDDDNAGGRVIRESGMLVVETSALKPTRGNRRNSSYTSQTVEKSGSIVKTTDASYRWDRPGGFMEATIIERDSRNREIQRSISRMVNYSSLERILLP
jgi:hypothetical protein